MRRLCERAPRDRVHFDHRPGDHRPAVAEVSIRVTACLVLVIIAFNLTRTAATITGAGLAKATTSTIRRKMIAIPAMVASSGRSIRLHLPHASPWEAAWTVLYAYATGPP